MNKKQGAQIKQVWNFLPWWPMKSRSSLFCASLQPVYYCNLVSVREKPSSYGQESIHSPQIVVFSVFGQFSDLDLRHNIFNPIIFISNKKQPWAVWFGFISGILFPLYSERKKFVANKRIFHYLCLMYQKREKRIKSFCVTVGIRGFTVKCKAPHMRGLQFRLISTEVWSNNCGV